MAETRKSFHTQLDDIQRDIVRLAAHVTERIPRVTEVLLAGDLEGAQAIIDADDELDALTLDIEDRCFHLFARQQPMASDMRTMVTAIRLTSEIERSGDLVVNIAKGSRRLFGSVIPARVRGLIGEMSDQASWLFKLAIDAYVESDAGLAAALDDLDDQLDERHREYIAAIIERDEDLELQPAVQLALIGRYYERIGDHAVNVGERVRYKVTGWMPEHTAPRHVARADGDGGQEP